jgi:hypothetical protein
MGKPLTFFAWLMLALTTQLALGNTLKAQQSHSSNFLFEGFENTSEFFFLDTEEQGWTLAPELSRQKLAHIISEPEGGKIHNLVVEVDGSYKIINLNRETEGSDNRQVVKMEDLKKKPAVLAQTEGRDVLVLHCRGCNEQGGGAFELKYLYNGMSMKYRSLKLDFRFDQHQRTWKLYAEKDKKMVLVEYLRLIPREIFGRLIGIKRIQVNH